MNKKYSTKLAKDLDFGDDSSSDGPLRKKPKKNMNYLVSKKQKCAVKSA